MTQLNINTNLVKKYKKFLQRMGEGSSNKDIELAVESLMSNDLQTEGYI